MTDQEMRIAIAKACGKCFGSMFIESVGGDLCAKCHKDRNDPIHHHPDYPNDLNAMHEAEKTLTTKEQQELYCYLLSIRCQVREELNTLPKLSPFEFVSSESYQRAKAFLRTIGKLKE
jgi:hypothetical protein